MRRRAARASLRLWLRTFCSSLISDGACCPTVGDVSAAPFSQFTPSLAATASVSQSWASLRSTVSIILTGLEHARVEPVALTARQGLQAKRQAVEGDGATVAVGDLAQAEALDVARVLVLGLDAGQRDSEGRLARMTLGKFRPGEFQRIEPRRRPAHEVELAGAEPHRPAELEGDFRQLVFTVVEVDVAIDQVFLLQAAATIELADELGNAARPQEVRAEREVGQLGLRQRGDHRAHRHRGLGILDPKARVAERIPGTNAIVVQGDYALGRQGQKLDQQ